MDKAKKNYDIIAQQAQYTNLDEIPDNLIQHYQQS